MITRGPLCSVCSLQHSPWSVGRNTSLCPARPMSKAHDVDDVLPEQAALEAGCQRVLRTYSWSQFKWPCKLSCSGAAKVWGTMVHLWSNNMCQRRSALSFFLSFFLSSLRKKGLATLAGRTPELCVQALCPGLVLLQSSSSPAVVLWPLWPALCPPLVLPLSSLAALASPVSSSSPPLVLIFFPLLSSCPPLSCLCAAVRGREQQLLPTNLFGVYACIILFWSFFSFCLSFLPSFRSFLSVFPSILPSFRPSLPPALPPSLRPSFLPSFSILQFDFFATNVDHAGARRG